jgi:hypothetical protein
MMHGIFISALLAMLCLPHLALAQQGRLPKPVQPLPSYPPVVCVAPNWKTESCEDRQEIIGLGPFYEFLAWLDTASKSWFGTVLHYDEPKAWNGIWPKQRETVVLFDEPGGIAQMQGSEWTSTNGAPGKWTMKCGSIEVVVVLRDYRSDKKVHIYAEQKILNRILSKEIKDGQIYFNGRQCIPTITWICPEEREC